PAHARRRRRRRRLRLCTGRRVRAAVVRLLGAAGAGPGLAVTAHLARRRPRRRPVPGPGARPHRQPGREPPVRGQRAATLPERRLPDLVAADGRGRDHRPARDVPAASPTVRRTRRVLRLGLVAGPGVRVGAGRLLTLVRPLLILGRRFAELLVGRIRVLLVAVVGWLLVTHAVLPTQIDALDNDRRASARRRAPTAFAQSSLLLCGSVPP